MTNESIYDSILCIKHVLDKEEKTAQEKLLFDMVTVLYSDFSKFADKFKDVTDQMHNEGNGEYTIPAWFARSLYEYIK